jgi:hypothetical protein
MKFKIISTIGGLSTKKQVFNNRKPNKKNNIFDETKP